SRGGRMETTVVLDVQPVTTAVGAVIGGVDLRRPLDTGTAHAIRQALLEHGVVFFHDQDITRDEMRAFVSNFGTPIPGPFSAGARPDPIGEADSQRAKQATAVWHSDTSFVKEPPGLTALRAVDPAPVGGDTCWGSMYSAYEALSTRMRDMLDGLTAV